MTEREWNSTVEATLNLLGWRWSHFRAARTVHGWRTPLSGLAGFPDVLACRYDRLPAIELKTDTGRLRPEQRDWLASLEAAGAEVFVWRPRDWPEVQEVLR